MAATGVRQEEPRQKGAKFVLSRLLSRDSTATGARAPSFRVYYGVASAGAVPFLWESQPGTPKSSAADHAPLPVPPLTPPPSYYQLAGAKEDVARRNRKAGSKTKRKSSRPAAAAGPTLASFLSLSLPRTGTGTGTGKPRSASSSSSSSSSFSSLSLSFRGARSPAQGSSMRRGSSRMHAFSDEEEEEDAAAAMTTCFRVRQESFRALRGCRAAMAVRSALASVGGTATAHTHRVV